MTKRDSWEQRWKKIVDGANRSPVDAAARASLQALSVLYEKEYNRRMKRLRGLPLRETGVPTISVGNIVLGGTGKTPVCRWLAERLLEKGCRVGILTRGYGRTAVEPIFATSKENIPWTATGDEPQLYLAMPGDIAVAVDPDRHRGAELMMEKFKPDVILLDDAYQFITLKRDWNILLLDAENPVGNGQLIPAGYLREPESEVKRADTLWFHRADCADKIQLENSENHFNENHEKDVIHSRYVPTFLQNLSSGEKSPPDAIKGMTTIAVSGLARPESFEKTVYAITNVVPNGIRFPDHHVFKPKDLEHADAEAARTGACVVTTEKDAVRIPADFSPRAEWWILAAGIEIMKGAESIEKRIDGLMKKANPT